MILFTVLSAIVFTTVLSVTFLYLRLSPFFYSAANKLTDKKTETLVQHAGTSSRTLRSGCYSGWLHPFPALEVLSGH